MGFFNFFTKNSNKNKPEKVTSPKDNVRPILEKYIVLDIETTGLSRYYSEIVQLSALKICNGKIVDKYDQLIRPRREIPNSAIAIHHITNEMVSHAPLFVEIVDEFLDFIGNSVLVGYNISSFDLHLLNNRLFFEKGVTLNIQYIDVLKTARQLSLPDYKLTTLARFYGFDTANAHNSLFDCIMTDECYRALVSNGYVFTTSEFVGPEFKFHTPAKLTESNQAILVLRTIMNDIVEDGKVELSEFNELLSWVKEHDNLRGEYPFDNINKELELILEDGIVEPSELEELASFIDEWLDPIGHARHSTINTLQGIHIVLTGDFEFGAKSVVEEYVLSKGAIIDKSTTKKTQLVLVGAQGSTAWVAGNYGTKIKKALEYRAKGQKIEIITEYDFFKEINNL